MRIAVVLLACLAAGPMTSAFADPQNEAQAAPAASSAPSAPAPAAAAAPTPAATPEATAAARAEAAKAELDVDTRHFLAEGYKPEMHHGEQVYCKKEEALGSRLAMVKNCGTIEQLKLAEQRAKTGVFDAQRQQSTGPTTH